MFNTYSVFSQLFLIGGLLTSWMQNPSIYHIYVHTHHTYIFIHIYCVYVCLDVCIVYCVLCMCVLVCVWMYVLHIYVCLCVYECVCMCICVCIYEFICVCLSTVDISLYLILGVSEVSQVSVLVCVKMAAGLSVVPRTIKVG